MNRYHKYTHAYTLHESLTTSNTHCDPHTRRVITPTSKPATRAGIPHTFPLACSPRPRFQPAVAACTARTRPHREMKCDRSPPRSAATSAPLLPASSPVRNLTQLRVSGKATNQKHHHHHRAKTETDKKRKPARKPRTLLFGCGMRRQMRRKTGWACRKHIAHSKGGRVHRNRWVCDTAGGHGGLLCLQRGLAGARRR